MAFKKKYMMFCFLILTFMLLNLQDENHCSRSRKCFHHSQLQLICYMANFIKLAICNMPKVYTSHSKPLESHLQVL